MTTIIPTSQAQANLNAIADTSKLFQELTHTTPMTKHTETTNPIAKYIFIGICLWCLTNLFSASNQDIGARNAKAQIRQSIATELEVPPSTLNIQSTLELKPACDLTTTTTHCK